jgi:DNA-binding beta-propeller fold protein YncE
VHVSATREPGSLSIGAGALWSTASTHGDSQVVRIDPATARVVASIRVRRAIGVAFGGGDAWVMTQPPSKSKNVFLPSRKRPGTVVRIDPGTNRVFGSPVQVPGLQPISVAFASGSAWIADYYDATVSRVDVLEPVGKA